MGLRGPGARPVAKPHVQASGIIKRKQRASWKRAGLTRSQRVIKFVEGLIVTAGEDAGKPFRLREWQNYK